MTYTFRFSFLEDEFYSDHQLLAILTKTVSYLIVLHTSIVDFVINTNRLNLVRLFLATPISKIDGEGIIGMFFHV